MGNIIEYLLKSAEPNSYGSGWEELNNKYKDINTPTEEMVNLQRKNIPINKIYLNKSIRDSKEQGKNRFNYLNRIAQDVYNRNAQEVGIPKNFSPNIDFGGENAQEQSSPQSIGTDEEKEGDKLYDTLSDMAGHGFNVKEQQNRNLPQAQMTPLSPMGQGVNVGLKSQGIDYSQSEKLRNVYGDMNKNISKPMQEYRDFLYKSRTPYTGEKSLVLDQDNTSRKDMVQEKPLEAQTATYQQQKIPSSIEWTTDEEKSLKTKETELLREQTKEQGLVQGFSKLDDKNQFDYLSKLTPEQTDAMIGAAQEEGSQDIADKISRFKDYSKKYKQSGPEDQYQRFVRSTGDIEYVKDITPEKLNNYSESQFQKTIQHYTPEERNALREVIRNNPGNKLQAQSKLLDTMDRIERQGAPDVEYMDIKSYGNMDGAKMDQYVKNTDLKNQKRLFSQLDIFSKNKGYIPKAVSDWYENKTDLTSDGQRVLKPEYIKENPGLWKEMSDEEKVIYIHRLPEEKRQMLSEAVDDKGNNPLKRFDEYRVYAADNQNRIQNELIDNRAKIQSSPKSSGIWEALSKFMTTPLMEGQGYQQYATPMNMGLLLMLMKLLAGRNEE